MSKCLEPVWAWHTAAAIYPVCSEHLVRPGTVSSAGGVKVDKAGRLVSVGGCRGQRERGRSPWCGGSDLPRASQSVGGRSSFKEPEARCAEPCRTWNVRAGLVSLWGSASG